MSGPWEDYKKEKGPWNDYVSPPTAPVTPAMQGQSPPDPFQESLRNFPVPTAGQEAIEGNPMIDPVTALTGGAVGGGVRGAAGALLTEPIIGQTAELAGKVHPALSLPVAIAMGLITGKGIDKVLAPGKAKLIPGGEELFQRAKTEGLPLSPDVFTKSKFTRAVRWISDQLPPGNWEAARMRGKINEKLMRARNDFITDTLKMQKPGAGKELREQASGIFAEVKEAGKGVSAPMNQLKTFLQENITDPDLKISKKTYDSLTSAHKRLAEDGSLSMDEINDLFAKVWGGGKFGKMTPSQVRIHGQLKSALDADMDAFEKQSSSQVYSLIKQGKELYKSAVEADKAKVIENMLSAATKYDADKQVYTFHPLVFKAQVERNMSKLEKIFKKDPGKIDLIKKFAQEMEISATDVARLSKAGGPLSLFEKAGAAGAVIYKPWLAVPAGFNAIMAHSLMNPRGWMKQWLTTGFKGTGRALPVAQAIKFPSVFEIQNLEGESTLK